MTALNDIHHRVDTSSLLHSLPRPNDSDNLRPSSPQSDVDTHDLDPPPDGGLTAWLCIASSFSILFCVFGFLTSIGQLQTYYLAHQLSSYSESTVAWIGSTQTTLTYIGSIFAGRFFDAHGVRGLVITGSSLLTGALIAVAFCQEYYQFFLAHAAYGIAGSIIYSPAAAISGHWFKYRRSTAVGLITCGSGLGGIVYPIMLKQLFDRLSFRDSILVVVALNASLLVPTCVFMKTRLPRRTPPPLITLLKPWHETQYALLVLGTGLSMINVLSPYFYAPVFAGTNGASNNVTDYSIAVIQAGSFSGRVCAGLLADWFGVWTVFGTSGFLCALVTFALWTPSAMGDAGVVIGIYIYGATSGAWFTLISAATGNISLPHEFGMRLGMLWTTVALPGLIGPVVCGALIPVANDKFTFAAVFCGFTFLMGTAITVAPRLRVRLRSMKSDE